MKRIILTLVLSFLFVFVGSAQAATIIYQWTGTFIDEASTAAYSLNSADVVFEYRFDDSSENIGTNSGVNYLGVSGSVQFLNRPNGALDLTVQMVLPELTLGLLGGNIGVYHDGYRFHSGGLVTTGTDIADINWDNAIETVGGGYPGAGGCTGGGDYEGPFLPCYQPHLPLEDHPNPGWDTNLASGLVNPFCSNTGCSEEGELAFIITSNSVSVVPIPAAVYLFASGLGLLGWFRRRA
jgi:hypothetical protein